MAPTCEQARELLGTELQPFLTTEAVASIAGIKPATLSQWVKRGYVKLRGSSRPGTGRAMLFSFSDLIEVLAFTHLSRLGFPPKGAAGELSEEVMTCAGQRLMELAGAYGDLSESSLGDFQRYVTAWHDENYDRISFSISPVPRPPEAIPHATWIVIDSFALLDRAFFGLEDLKGKK